MAKDPAFLFFPGDWLGGTMTFSRSHKGAYMDLLMAQFNQGHMGLHDILHILGDKDFHEMWESKLKFKFKIDESGKYYNEKLDNEIVKRKKYTESRRKNLDKKNNHMGEHMENGDGNGNTVTLKVSGGGKENSGWKFSDNGKGVIFPDGIYQPLGFEQKIAKDQGTLMPRDVKRGLIY